MGAVAMRPSRRDSAYGRGSTPGADGAALHGGSAPPPPNITHAG